MSLRELGPGFCRLLSLERVPIGRVFLGQFGMASVYGAEGGADGSRNFDFCIATFFLLGRSSAISNRANGCLIRNGASLLIVINRLIGGISGSHRGCCGE